MSVIHAFVKFVVFGLFTLVYGVIFWKVFEIKNRNFAWRTVLLKLAITYLWKFIQVQIWWCLILFYSLLNFSHHVAVDGLATLVVYST